MTWVTDTGAMGTERMVQIVEVIDELQDSEGWTSARLIARSLHWPRPEAGAVLGHCVKVGWVEVRNTGSGDRYGLTERGGEVAYGAAN